MHVPKSMLMNLANAMYAARIVKPETLRLHTSAQPELGSNLYGYAFATRARMAKRPLVGHGGNSSGQCTESGELRHALHDKAPQGSARGGEHGFRLLKGSCGCWHPPGHRQGRVIRREAYGNGECKSCEAEKGEGAESVVSVTGSGSINSSPK